LNFIKIIFFILFTGFLFAQKVDITADNMKAEDMKKEVHFMGNAKVVQGKNWIHGDEIIVYFDENNETKKYEAVGLVTFAFIQEKSSYEGSADRVTYYPVKDQYILTGRAIINDLISKRHVNGDEIILDMKTGNANVKGSRKKPVKFIFDMKDKK
jgi:lipopolysaccharide export system protein LptA